MTYKYATFFKWISVCSDFLLLNLALYIAFFIQSPFLSFWADTSENYRLNFLLLNLLWFYCSSLVKLYENVIVREVVSTIWAVVTALAIFIIAPLILTLTFRRFSFSTEFFTNFFLLFSGFLLITKITFLSVRKSSRKIWLRSKDIVIVGGGKVSANLLRYIKQNPQLGYRVVGIFDDKLKKEQNEMIIGTVSDCFEYVRINKVSEIFCALPDNELEKVKELMQWADKHMVRLRLVPDLKGFEENIMIEVYGNMPILSPRNEPLENKANEVVKRAFDFGFSLMVTLFLLSWLIPLLAVIIKLDSRGPVFFKQLRSGKDNKPFYCYKFRSMQVNFDSDKLQATKGDARITRVGAFLRKTSLDELPQFFNVLLGDMSVVGPRPHMLKHTQDYSLLIGKFMIRHFLTPGITGWAQVSGHRGETKEPSAMSKRVEADLWYLENWTLFLDLKIIFLTVWNSFKGDDKAF